MITLVEIAEIAALIENMTEDEIAEAMIRLEKMANMQLAVNKAYQTNPMVFSGSETIQ